MEWAILIQEIQIKSELTWIKKVACQYIFSFQWNLMSTKSIQNLNQMIVTSSV